jgi:hypothetical protein
MFDGKGLRLATANPSIAAFNMKAWLGCFDPSVRINRQPDGCRCTKYLGDRCAYRRLPDAEENYRKDSE